jgi:stage V sporulation protein G
LGSIGIHKNLNKDGYRITYPTKKVGDKDINIFHPINKEASRLIEDKIVFKAEQIFG